MGVRLHIKNEDFDVNKIPELHSMPCKILTDDTANVSKCFTPFIKKTLEDKKLLTCSFRGYPLQGKVVPVPEGYKGITFYEYKPPETEDAERNIYATGTFTQLTYWNYDKIPSRNDALIAALDWIDVAEALHQPEDEPVDNN